MAPVLMSVLDVMKAQRAEGLATVLAIGTANPAHCVYQAEYPDFYFRVTESDHLTDIKRKFTKICKLLKD